MQTTLSQAIWEMEAENRRLRENYQKLLEELGREPRKPMECKSCRFFMQHYVREDGRYFKTNSGHCTQGVRIKYANKSPEAAACRYCEVET